MKAALDGVGVRVRVDDRDHLNPGAKFYEWERKGVPMRIELGPKDLDKGQVCVKMRVDTKGVGGRGKEFVSEDAFISGVRQRLLDYQDQLLAAARQRMADNIVTLDTWEQFEDTFAGESSKFAWCHWDGTAETEAAIKTKTKVTIRCIPLEGQGPAPEPGTCIFSGKPSAQRVLMAKAY